MTRIFLSPSNQVSNVGAYGDTNECEQCTLIANAAKKYLESNYLCDVYVALQTDHVKTRADYANEQNIDIYIAIHTNAFGDPTVEGTETFYYSNDEPGRKLAEALLASVGDITGSKRRAKPNDSLIELNTPTCTRAYIEVDFHSNPQKAQWIKQNTDLIGNTIGKTVAEFAMLQNNTNQKIELPNTDEAEDDITRQNEKMIIENAGYIFDVIEKNNALPNDNKLYRVQVGAYSHKKNAVKMAEKLKKAGFSAVIKYS